MMPANRTLTEKITLAFALAGLALLLFGLAHFAWAGTHTRFWADDYCYSAEIKQSGLIRGVANWYQVSGNRLSTLAPVALSDLFGIQAVRFVPAAVLALWVGAAFFFFAGLNRAVSGKARPLWSGLLALGLAYYMVLLAPDRLQAVYWRMGIFHYSLPMPLLMIHLGLALRGLRSPRSPVRTGLLLGGLAFFTAGLSETGAALEVGVIGAALLLALALLDRAGRLRAARLLAPSLLGALAMMAVMTQAPANAWRQAVMPPPENLWEIVPVSLRHAADFAFYSLRGRPAAFLAFGLLAFAVGFLGYGEKPREMPGGVWKPALAAVLALLVGYGWIVFSFAPSSFASLQYPAGRALMPGHFALLAGLGAAALFAARALAAAVPGGWARWAALALLAAACLYPLRGLPVARQDAAELAARAARWDGRAAQIREQAARGVSVVEVRQADVVQGLEDIGPDPDFWINRCAAVVFDAGSIVAGPE